MSTVFHQSTHLCSDIDTRSMNGVYDGPENFIILSNKTTISKYNVSQMIYFCQASILFLC